MDIQTRAAARGASYRLLLHAGVIAAACFWPNGCALNGKRDTSIKQDDHHWMSRLAVAYLQTPSVIGAPEGSTWDFDPLPADELQVVLSKRMPPAGAVPPDASTIEVLAECLGKRLVIVPPQAGALLMQEFGFPHKYRQSPFPGASLGECLQTILDSLAPITGAWLPKEQESILGSPVSIATRVPCIYTICLTKRHVLFIRVPRDVPYAPAASDVVDRKAAQWRRMKEEQKNLQEQWLGLPKGGSSEGPEFP